MSEAKFIVIYPRPTNIDALEKIYLEEHVPLAVAKLVGKTKIVATKIMSSPKGASPYRIAEIHFPSKEALGACAATLGAQEVRRRSTRLGPNRRRRYNSFAFTVLCKPHEELPRSHTLTKKVAGEGRWTSVLFLSRTRRIVS